MEIGQEDQVVSLRSTVPATVTFEATPDAALLDITMPHWPADHYEPRYDYHYIQIDSIAVTVKNKGTNLLEQVTINSVLAYSDYICQVEDQFKKVYSRLNLQPGQSTTLYVGAVTQPTHSISTVTSLCFWTTLPNDSLDHNAMNNRLCKTFQVIVTVEDPGFPSGKLQIVPNPAKDDCTLTWAGQSKNKASIQVINMTGQQVAIATTEGNEWEFERHSLPPGIYNVLVTTGNGQQITGKVVFE